MTRHMHTTVSRRAVYALRLSALGLIVAAWFYATEVSNVSALLVPKMSAVLIEFWDLLQQGSFWYALVFTLFEIFVSAGVAALLGLLIGFWIARTKARRKIFEPMFGWAYMVPFVLFYPMFVLVFGIGPVSKIAFAGIGAVFPIVYLSARGFSAVNDQYLTMARAYGANKRQIDWQIKLPAALPVIRSALRIGLAMSFIYVILGEMLGSAKGLGYNLAQVSQTLRIPESYALTILILILAAFFQLFLNRVVGGDKENSKH